MVVYAAEENPQDGSVRHFPGSGLTFFLFVPRMDVFGALRNSQSLGHFTSLTLDVRDRILVKLFASKITVYGGDRGLGFCPWHPSLPCLVN